MLNILIISPRIPYPLNQGSKILIFNTIKFLALRGHQITLLAFKSENEMQSDELLKYCRLITIQKDTGNSLWGAVKNIFSTVPYNISKYHSRTVSAEIRKVLNNHRFDVVDIEQLHMAFYGDVVRNAVTVPIVLREHNVEMTIMERFYQNHHNLFIKAYAYVQYKKLFRYEPATCASFDRVITISENDAIRLRDLNSEVSTVSIPAGVDTKYFTPREGGEEPLSIVHVGAMNWLPNVEAILWFCDKVFPIIQRAHPHVIFYIVGGNPPSKIKSLANDNIVVTGYVDDPRNYIANGQVYVVPLLTGGGIRIKILEALAMKKALVSTSIGCEGIAVEHNRHLSVADTPEAFARAVLELFENPVKRKALSEEGYQLIQNTYTWPQVAEAFERVYHDVLK